MKKPGGVLRPDVSYARYGWDLSLIGVLIGAVNWKPDMSHPRHG